MRPSNRRKRVARRSIASTVPSKSLMTICPPIVSWRLDNKHQTGEKVRQNVFESEAQARNPKRRRWRRCWSCPRPAPTESPEIPAPTRRKTTAPKSVVAGWDRSANCVWRAGPASARRARKTRTESPTATHPIERGNHATIFKINCVIEPATVTAMPENGLPCVTRVARTALESA